MEMHHHQHPHHAGQQQHPPQQQAQQAQQQQAPQQQQQQQLQIPPDQQQQQQQPTPQPQIMDYGTIKHLLSEAEMQQQQSALSLTHAQSALQAAQSQHDALKASHDEAIAKVETLKSQFREQIMDEGLRQSCRWNDMYYKLVEWKECHEGDTTVPCDAKNSGEDVKKLNRWVVNQRTSYKYFMNGDKKHIKDHRISALNKIGFVWSVTDQLWDNNFEDLQRHHAETGTFNVIHKKNRKLAAFVSRLRTAMSHKNDGLVQQELTDDRIKKLDSINFNWDLKRKPRKTTTNQTVKFDVMFNHLVSFKEIYSHLKVNKLEKEWKKGIGAPPPDKKVFRRLPLFMAFVRKEQLLYAEGQPCSLDEEKVRLLTELGVEWRKPIHEPRKSTGGESTRKLKRKRVDMMDGHLPENHTVVAGVSGGYHYPEDGGEEEQQNQQQQQQQHDGGMVMHAPPGLPDSLKQEGQLETIDC